jgi:hypothetical protein
MCLTASRSGRHGNATLSSQRFDWERSGLVLERSIAAHNGRRVAVPHLRYVRENHRFSRGASIAPD